MEKRIDAFEPLKVLEGFLSAYPIPTEMVCALSGGADSVCLLLAMKQFSIKNGIALHAFHVHHGIRGEAADLDLSFCQRLCNEYDISLVVARANVPAYAKEHHMSLESAAREVRYQCFAEHLRNRPQGTKIFLAHNATDQAETILFRMARGTGLLGLGGIAPMRNAFLRPFLHISAESIRSYLENNGVAYCLDETNCSLAYTRNRIRHKLLPELEAVHNGATIHIASMADSLREDEAFITEAALHLLDTTPEYTLRNTLRTAHPALAKRVIRILHQRVLRSQDAISASLLEEVYHGICSEANYQVFTLPGDVRAYADRGYFYCQHKDSSLVLESYHLDLGLHIDDERGCAFLLSSREVDLQTISLPNVYNSVTHQTFASDTIMGSLYIRAKMPGDAYLFAGCTHKVNTLFTDAKLAKIERLKTPILCDNTGIVWVPHFAVRDSSRPTHESHTMHLYYFSHLEEPQYES